jgi:hypothetical protein
MWSLLHFLFGETFENRKKSERGRSQNNECKPPPDPLTGIEVEFGETQSSPPPKKAEIMSTPINSTKAAPELNEIRRRRTEGFCRRKGWRSVSSHAETMLI